MIENKIIIAHSLQNDNVKEMNLVSLSCLCLPKEIIRRRQWHSTPVLLPGKSHGRRSLEGCSPWGCWGSDTTEWLHFHFSLSCIGEGNGNPLQCSCLENPRDGRAWCAAVYGVTQSRTRLKWLCSSSKKIICSLCNTRSNTRTKFKSNLSISKDGVMCYYDFRLTGSLFIS